MKSMEEIAQLRAARESERKMRNAASIGIIEAPVLTEERARNLALLARRNGCTVSAVLHAAREGRSVKVTRTPRRLTTADIVRLHEAKREHRAERLTAYRAAVAAHSVSTLKGESFSLDPARELARVASGAIPATLADRAAAVAAVRGPRPTLTRPAGARAAIAALKALRDDGEEALRAHNAAR